MTHLRYIYVMVAVMAALCSTVGGRAATDVVAVEGESTYIGERNQGPEECKRMALQMARIDAMAKEFGTTVSNVVLTTGNYDSENSMLMSETEVNGEWIVDEGEPQFDIQLNEHYNLVVKCRVKGKARQLSNEAARFRAAVLRNGTDPERNQATEFINGDQMLVHFQAPTAGYVAMFLLDDARQVMRLLPYPLSQKSEIAVKGSRPYIFFDDTKLDEWQQTPDGLVMYTEKDSGEWNRLYILFSPNAFSLPTDGKDISGIPTLSLADFSKWLTKARRTDPKMGQQVFNLHISREAF